jgi:hypothetical protein
MFASIGVDTALGQSQTLDRTVAYNVGLYDFCHVCQPYVAVPNCLGIHHHGRSMFALIQASGLVGTDCVL